MTAMISAKISWALALCTLLLAGCDPDPSKGSDDTAPLADQDRDGSSDGEDCDDDDAAVHPGAMEICDDGIDNDCSGGPDGDADNCVTSADDDSPELDQDDDGHDAAEDCDDDDKTVYVGAPEGCDDIDSDCDGLDGPADGMDPADCEHPDEVFGPFLYGPDDDQDGYPADGATLCLCALTADALIAEGANLASTETLEDGVLDCDDADPSFHPGAQERCDAPELDLDCDDVIAQNELASAEDELEGCAWGSYRDGDGDGSGGDAVCTCPEAGTLSGTVHARDDCDDDDGTVGVCEAWCEDADRDGYPGGDASADTSADACDVPLCLCPDEVASLDMDSPGAVLLDEVLQWDCDDEDAAVHPFAEEVCESNDEADQIDNDCDGDTQGLGATGGLTYYVDKDGDGYGNDDSAQTRCFRPDDDGQTYVPYAGDCDDADENINPKATEACDEADNDCDGYTDESVTTTFYYDFDSDGYGTVDKTIEACTIPTYYADNKLDCDDSDSAINPRATETCNEKDDDCDGAEDELVARTYYLDEDGDGYGTADTSGTACSKPDGYSSRSTDCDDTDADVNPRAEETCNEIDDDCDDSTDEYPAGKDNLYYSDADGDGYGAGSPTTGCSTPTGYVTNGTDCNDSSSSINPGVSDLCNGVDNNCDGTIDDDATWLTWYPDDDEDDKGDYHAKPRDTKSSCYTSTSEDVSGTMAGYVPNNDDCDDDDDTVGGDLYYEDLDDDGYWGCGASVDPTSISPTGTLSYAAAYYVACVEADAPLPSNDYGCEAAEMPGYVPFLTGWGDCDDTEEDVHRTGEEAGNCADGLDNDCDGLLDEDDPGDCFSPGSSP